MPVLVALLPDDGLNDLESWLEELIPPSSLGVPVDPCLGGRRWIRRVVVTLGPTGEDIASLGDRHVAGRFGVPLGATPGSSVFPHPGDVVGVTEGVNQQGPPTSG